MPEYDIAFAAKLASLASEVDERDPSAYDAGRAAVYLGRLSAEISLKALLERAGVPIPSIRCHNHRLKDLLLELERCEVEIESPSGSKQWCSASAVRNAAIDLGAFHLQIGELIEGKDPRISKYPNGIRYGETVIDYPPSLIAGMAVVLAEWAKKNWNSIRVRNE